MFNFNYDVPLRIMVDENCPLSSVIENFINNIPDVMRTKIARNASKCRKTIDDKIWHYVDDGSTMNISLGSAKNISREYFNLCVNKNNYESIFNKTLNGFGEVDLGFVTIYIPSTNRKEENEAAIFKFSLKRKKAICRVDVTTRFNRYMKSNIEVLEKVGFSDIIPLLESCSYSVNLEEIVKSMNKSKKI